MNIDANVNLEIDVDDLFSEMEGDISNHFEHLVGEWGLQDYDEVNGMIDDKVHDYMAEYAEAIELTTTDNVSEMITTALDDHDTELNVELIDLRNEVLKARRSIQVLLEEREARLSTRVKRVAGQAMETAKALSRKVHWHMPRR